MHPFVFGLISLAVITSASALSAAQCLPGHKHKEKPTPGETRFAACESYESRPCCEASFTQQLASSPVRAIGNFSWTPCGSDLTPTCEKFMVEIECFYRCAPDITFWKNPDFPSAVHRLPVCARYCDEWFDACRSDLTCGEDWLRDFDTTTTPSSCKPGRSCKNMTEMYTDGKTMCETLWGTSFMYKKSKEANDCFNLSKPPNGKVARYYGFGPQPARAPMPDPMCCSVFMAGVLGGFFLAQPWVV